MDEAKKTNIIRGPEFSKKYLIGRVIDIGAGSDLVCAWAESFDVDEGDANHITKFRCINSYDTVHSSHCLEHMLDVNQALLEWWSLIKPGGYLVLVVPDEDLYEQGFWPSIFNSDHKATFTLKRGKSWSPVSHNIYDLISSLPHSEILSIETHDKNYDYKLQTKLPIDGIAKKRPKWLKNLSRVLNKFFLGRKVLAKIENSLFFKFQIPIDQTLRTAVAQIQVIAQKRPENTFRHKE